MDADTRSLARRSVSDARRRLAGAELDERGQTDMQVSQGLDAVVEAIATKHLHALFFTKLTDWASEHEFRF